MLKAEYLYNARRRQVVRRLTQGVQTIHSVHDLDGNRIAEYDYDPSTHTATLLREYIWMDGRAVGVIENGTLYFVRTDWIGRPSFATNSAGTKVWEAQYLPFGGVHTSTGTPLELRFPGQWFQSESGLHQNRMHDYDPTTGRYIQADLLGLVDGASIYGYALQNPGRFVDFMGLFVEDDPPGGGGDGPGERKSPDQCLIYRIFDGPGLESREYPIIFGKLCVYICYNPNEYKKQTYSMRYATCPATNFRFVLSPMSKIELTILGIGG